MNRTYECDNCTKKGVCKYVEEYTADRNNTPFKIRGRTTKVIIKCKEFSNVSGIREVIEK